METLKNMTEMQKIVGAFVIGVVVGVAGFWAVSSGTEKTTSTKTSTATKSTSNTTLSSTSSSKIDTEANVMDKTLPATEVKSLPVVTPTTPAVPVSSTGATAVAVDEQKAGNTVAVTMLTLSNPGWVVIHEDRNGKPGNVLGATWYQAGIHLAKVELLRSTVVGGTYYAMIHSDDGDKQFDLKKDLPLMDASGNPIMAMFKVN